MFDHLAKGRYIMGVGPGGLPPDFESYVAQMRSYARHVIEAEDLAAAAAAVSKMAKTCGNCPLVNGVELEFGYDREPRQDIEDANGTSISMSAPLDQAASAGPISPSHRRSAAH